MNTHITTAPDIDERSGAPLGSPIRLPGGRGTLPHLEDHDLEPDSQAVAEPGTNDTIMNEPRGKLASSTSAPARRTGLLSTAAFVVVLTGISGVAWAERQGTINLPLPPQMVALLRTGLPVSSQVAGEIGVQPARTSTLAPTVARPKSDQSAQLVRQHAEFAALKSGEAVTEVGIPTTSRPATSPPLTTSLPVAQAGPPPAMPTTLPAPIAPPISTEVSAPISQPLPAAPPQPSPAAIAAVTPALATPGVTTSVVATAPAVAISPASVPTPRPRDAVQTAIDVRAEPMSTKQQVDVVGLVRELGAQLKETRLTVAQLKETVADLKEQFDSRMTEFDGRLGLAEAGTVLTQSAKAALPQPVIPAPVLPTRSSIATRQSVSDLPVAAPVSTANRSVKDFRVQGASPGLAVLNALVPGPGEAPVLYVSLGDQVPGLGHIKSIYQRGTTWVVQTDAGLIQ